jgi:hypothetical protein
MTSTRRLAAILAADVAGYSRLMGVDEEGTLERLVALRQAIIDPTVGKSGGRIVKTTGDGFLIEFPSAVEAVRCALDIQEQTREHEKERSDRKGIPRHNCQCAISPLIKAGRDLAKATSIRKPGSQRTKDSSLWPAGFVYYTTSRGNDFVNGLLCQLASRSD